MARPPFGPLNRNQRVPDRACAGCGGPVLRAPRGPAPRWCLACDRRVRRRRQARAYLRSAARIADELRLDQVADLARTAVLVLDSERTDA